MKLKRSTLETAITFTAGAIAVIAHDVVTQKTGKNIPQLLFVLPVTMTTSYLAFKNLPKRTELKITS